MLEIQRQVRDLPLRKAIPASQCITHARIQKKEDSSWAGSRRLQHDHAQMGPSKASVAEGERLSRRYH